MNPVTATIVDFLRELGLTVEPAMLSDETFLPGIEINMGRLLFDENRMLYPGDLLHEAGHLAVLLPEQRTTAHLNVTDSPADEMMAISWSYAAALHLGLDPRIVFHEAGYHGGSESLLENFSAGRYLALPMLQWIGLTYEPRNAPDGVLPYPHMIRWLREAAESYPPS